MDRAERTFVASRTTAHVCRADLYPHAMELLNVRFSKDPPREVFEVQLLRGARRHVPRGGNGRAFLTQVVILRRFVAPAVEAWQRPGHAFLAQPLSPSLAPGVSRALSKHQAINGTPSLHQFFPSLSCASPSYPGRDRGQ